MTERLADPLDPPEATQAAVAAATAADVVIRELHRMEQLKAAQRLFEEVWRPAEGQPPPVTGELLRALAHAGSYVVGAYAGTRMVGASAGFFTAPPDPALHSHITGVAPQGQRRGIGFALKVHQRAWALARGGPAPALPAGPAPEPVAHDTGAPLATVEVPPGVEALGPGPRRAWREAVRQALGGRLAAGAAVTGFLRRPDRYLLTQPPTEGR